MDKVTMKSEWATAIHPWIGVFVGFIVAQALLVTVLLVLNYFEALG